MIATYEDGSTEIMFRLRTPSGESVELVFDAPPAVDPGAAVIVQGTRDGPRKFHVSSIEVVPTSVETELRPLATEQADRPLPPLKVAVLVLDPNYTTAQARKRLLDDPDGPRSFYRDNTFGNWNIAGDAFGPLKVDTFNCAERFDDIATEALQAARDAGVDIDGYTQVAYYVPRAGSNCGWSGLGDVGKMPSRTATGPSYGKPARDSWYAGTLGCGAFNQELGHNYGLQHGHICLSPPYTGSCQGYSEYGDPYSPMGNGCGHLTAVEIGELNGFTPCNVIDVIDGTYEMGAIEQACTGPQVLRWKDPKGARRAEYVYVEYRRKLGIEATSTRLIEGIYIHYGAEYKDPSVLNWQTPANGASDFLVPTGGTASKAALLAGQSWTAVGGAVFHVVSLGDTAVVQVSNTGRTGGATCLDGTMASGPPTCCAGATCGGPGPDGGVRDSGGLNDARAAGEGGLLDAARDGAAEDASHLDAARTDAATNGSAGAGAEGGPMVAGAGGAAGSTIGAAGKASAPARRSADDLAGGCSCRLSGAPRPRIWNLSGVVLLAAWMARKRGRMDGTSRFGSSD